MIVDITINDDEIVGSVDFSKINDESDLYLALRREPNFFYRIEYLYDQLLILFRRYKVSSFGFPYKLSYEDTEDTLPSYEEYMSIPPPEYSE